ncbi:MAG: alpha-amylase [Blautia sp.]|nr:alpha-amylase [Blautia sp.]
MAWYDEAVFYHIYPLGLTGAPKHNSYGAPEHRLNTLIPWISHIRDIGCNALYIGPLFESVGHGYETTDYKKLDSRLGINEDLTYFVKECHKQGIRVILDGVFNHTGRDFFAFQDIRQNREGSGYRDWYCNVNFWGNNEYNDGFSYDNWGGYNLLVKLNQRNPAVQQYICDVIRFWVKEFDIDGIRLDAADVLDFDFMKVLRQTANTVKADFWLMGEVIHGDYARWANADTLHSVTNYHLHKALYSCHNDHNYFETAHTVRRLNNMGGNGLRLYNFVDNHDVERIYTKLNNKAHYTPANVLLYTLPGIPSIYYGSEFGIEGRKERGSDDSLRPYINLADHADAVTHNPCTRVIARLGKARQQLKALAYGSYNEHLLTTTQYAFSRSFEGQNVLVTVNNADNSFHMNLPACGIPSYIGILTGQRLVAENDQVHLELSGNSGEVWVPEGSISMDHSPQNLQDIPAAKESPLADTVSRVKEFTAMNTASGVEESPIPDTTMDTEKEPAADSVSNAKESDPAAVTEMTPAKSAAPGELNTDTETMDSNEPFPGIVVPWDKPYEAMTVEELQRAIYEKMKKNGPVTDRMYRDIADNVYHSSLVNWAKSFR